MSKKKNNVTVFPEASQAPQAPVDTQAAVAHAAQDLLPAISAEDKLSLRDIQYKFTKFSKQVELFQQDHKKLMIEQDQILKSLFIKAGQDPNKVYVDEDVLEFRFRPDAPDAQNAGALSASPAADQAPTPQA